MSSKKTLREGGSTRQPINVPLPDWAPLWTAPFFCLSDGPMHTAETWPDAFCDEVRQLTSSPHVGRSLHPLQYEWPKWSATVLTNRKDVRIDALGVSTTIAPSPGFVGMAPKIGLSGGWSLSNWDGGFLDAPGWDRDIPQSDKEAVSFHKIMLTNLVRQLTANFASAIETGAAHLMARPRSVLNPFERIAWDQWRFFHLDNIYPWYDVRIASYISDGLPATAMSPNGERLYSVYVAPGSGSKGKTPEDQCQQWLLELLRDYPDQRPRPLQKLCEDSISMFPGLTKRGFQRALMFAQAKSGNRKWSEAGAPRKIPAQIPAK